MMAWIESHQTLARHPKTRKLAALLGISKPAAIGHLFYFWWWALDYADDGNLDSLDNLDIAIGAEWEGDADEFVRGMIAVGFIDDVEEGRCIHDWHDYAGKLVDRRKANAKRMREARAASNGARDTQVQRTSYARVEPQNTTEQNTTEPSDSHESLERATDGLVFDSENDKSSSSKFSEFWGAYPKKVGKGAAAKAFKGIKWRGVEFADLMAALERQKQSVQWREEGGRFIPNPSTWLNQERWGDELPDRSIQANGGSPLANHQSSISRDQDEAETNFQRELVAMGITRRQP